MHELKIGDNYVWSKENESSYSKSSSIYWESITYFSLILEHFKVHKEDWNIWGQHDLHYKQSSNQSISLRA